MNNNLRVNNIRDRYAYEGQLDSYTHLRALVVLRDRGISCVLVVIYRQTQVDVLKRTFIHTIFH